MRRRINEFRSHVKGSRDKRVGNRLDEFHSCACGCRRSRSGVKRFVPLGWWLGGGMLGGSKTSVHVIYLHPCQVDVCFFYVFSFFSSSSFGRFFPTPVAYVCMAGTCMGLEKRRGISSSARVLQTFLTLRRYKYLQARCKHFRRTTGDPRPTCETCMHLILVRARCLRFLSPFVSFLLVNCACFFLGTVQRLVETIMLPSFDSGDGG